MRLDVGQHGGAERVIIFLLARIIDAERQVVRAEKIDLADQSGVGDEFVERHGVRARKVDQRQAVAVLIGEIEGRTTVAVD